MERHGARCLYRISEPRDSVRCAEARRKARGCTLARFSRGIGSGGTMLRTWLGWPPRFRRWGTRRGVPCCSSVGFRLELLTIYMKRAVITVETYTDEIIYRNYSTQW
jgi:hypothetical protein